MSGGQFKMPLTMMIGYGGGYNDAAQHSQCLIATLAHVPGIRIATPADSHDAKGLMHTCLRDDNLTIWMVAQAHLGSGLARHRIENCGSPPCRKRSTRFSFGKARIWREGKDVTLVAYGITVHWAVQAAEKLAAEGISAEVLDLRTIVPMDRDAIFQSGVEDGPSWSSPTRTT